MGEFAGKYNYVIDFSNENTSHVKSLNLVGKDKDVLEIGCASGYLTRFLKETLGCRVVGVEVEAEAAEKAKPFCREIIVGDVETLDLKTKLGNHRFDVIMMTDLLEHLKDPGDLLRRLKTYLKKSGGYLVLSVPNGVHGSLALETLDGKWEYRKEGLLDKTHLRFFDKHSLSMFLEEAGYYISQIDRVIIHPRDTELKTPWDNYPREVTAYLEKVNPEYQTYQFVIQAHMMTSTGWKKGLEDSVEAEKKKRNALSGIVKEYEKELSFLRGEYAGFQNELKKREKEYLSDIEKELERLEDEKTTISDGFEKEIERLEDENKSLHKRYQDKIASLEAEKESVRKGYQDKIIFLEAEKKAIQKGYKDKIISLEAEKEAIRKGYKDKITSLEKELDQKDARYVDEVEKFLGRIEEESEEKEKQFKVLQGTTEALNQKLSNLSTSITSQRVRNSELQSTLDEIYNSVSWVLVGKFRRFVEKWLPEGSGKRRFYRLCIMAPVVLFREGGGVFYRKLHEKAFHKKKEAIKKVHYETSLVFETISLPSFKKIRVSIVIPVHNQVSHTYRCLQSLVGSTEVPYEVIVYDNGSMDETKKMLRKVQNVRVIQDTRNLGFVEACNKGAVAATGEFVLFLNNDTQVTNGWLEAMLAPFISTDVGAVGGKLIYPDGRLQEAGNIIWQDGSGWNYGHEDDPELPQYCYRKEVDYCSAACMAIQRQLWEEIGGFDQQFAPAYYEDTDLCFSVRARGYKVIYQPEARVIHHEGATAGTDINQGFKKFQQINSGKFKQKWQSVLNDAHYEGPEQLYLARERSVQRRALVIDHYVPTYDKDSGSLRMFRLLKIMTEIGYKVTFWPENLMDEQPYTNELQQLGIEVIYGDSRFEQYLKQYGKYFDLILLSRPHIAIKFIDTVKAYTDAKVIYDTVDLHYLREGRRADLETDIEKKSEIEAMAFEWKKQELYLSRNSDVVLVVSDIEKEILEKEEGLSGKVSVVSNVHCIESCHNGFEQRKGIMFIGGFVHQPNEDGIIWFVRDIFPKILIKIPDLRLFIVGSYPTSAVQALGSKNVTVTGYVPDVSNYFEQSRVFICPLRYGAGVKGKVGQSLSYGLPVVTTSVGAEGIGLIHQKTAMIADDDESFTNAVIDLYGDKTMWETLSENGRMLIEETFSPEVIKEKFHLVCEGGVCE